MMKLVWMGIGLIWLLTGCAAQDTFETIADEPELAVMAAPAEVGITLPEEAAVSAMQSEDRQIYLCDAYEIILETCSSGDLGRTIRSLSGFEREELTVMKTLDGTLDRYEFVWAAASGEGQRQGRAVILDDGNYHYCLSVLWNADTGPYDWETLCGSFHLK